MLRADSMPRSENAALEQAERRFNSVCMNIAVHVEADAVHDCLVLCSHSRPASCSAILSQVIGHQNFDVIGNVLSDVLFKSSRSHIFGMEESEFALPLADSNDHFLVGCTATALPMRPTADIRLVHLDNSAEFGLVYFRHCGADAVAEIPCRFVGHSDRALNLAGGHPLFRFAEKRGSDKPFPQRKMRIMEDSSRRDTELVVA